MKGQRRAQRPLCAEQCQHLRDPLLAEFDLLLAAGLAPRWGHIQTAPAAALLGLNLRQIRYRIARLNITVGGDTDAACDTSPHEPTDR